MQGGFTYIGAMILIAILAVTSAAVLSVGSSMQRRVNEEELLFIGGEFATAFRSYFEATPVGQRNYPAKLDELLKDPRYPGIRRHLRKIYVDPMTGTAEWGVVAAPGGIIGVHSFSQQAPIKIDQFDPAFAALTGKTSYAQWAFGFLPPGVVPAGNVTLAGTNPLPVESAPQKPSGTPAGALPSVVPSPSPSAPAQRPPSFGESAETPAPR
jgi:type II secretory pathway pseudopilin PulG